MIDKDEDEGRTRDMMQLSERMYPGTSDIFHSRYVRRSKVTLSIRLTPQVKATVYHIIERDKPPSLAVLFEEMLATYLDKHGAISPAELMSDAVKKPSAGSKTK